MERGSRVGGDNMRMVETGCFSVKTRQQKNTTPIWFQQHSPIFHKVRIPWFKAKLLPISQQISRFFFCVFFFAGDESHSHQIWSCAQLWFFGVNHEHAESLQRLMVSMLTYTSWGWLVTCWAKLGAIYPTRPGRPERRLNDEQRGPITDCENERDQPSTRAETQQRSLAIFRSLISAPKC